MKKRRGRGQISIFIIVCIFLVLAIAVGALFFVKDNKNIKQFIDRQSVSSEVLPVYENINDCSYERAVDAVRVVGLQGGYVNLPKDYQVTSYSNVAYGFLNGKNILPSKEKMQKEISSYISFTVPFCPYTENLEDYEVLVSNPEVNTLIRDNDVKISIKMPISVSKDNSTYELSKTYDQIIPLRLGDMYDVAKSIVEREVRGERDIPLGYLSNLPYKTFIVYQDNSKITYALIDVSENSKINNLSYSFLFANDFGGNDERE